MTVEYLFHYTPCDCACKILRTGQLRLSPFTEVNDPKEVIDWVSRLAATGEHVVIPRDKYKMACFSQGSYLKQQGGGPLDHGWGMGNMWAHYASDYNGLCLVFDGGKLEACFDHQFEGSQLHHGPVDYNNDCMEFSEVQARGPSEGGVMEYLLFHKFEWWSNEKEYRWVVRTEDQEDTFLDYGDALVAVAMGDGCCVGCRREVDALSAARPAVRVSEIGFQNGMPYLSHRASDPRCT